MNDMNTVEEFYEYSGQKQFVCEINGCTKAYKYKTHLKRHIRISHEQKERTESIQCSECGQVLTSKDTYKKHFRNRHERQQHCCNYCEASFRKENHLQEHLIVHTGETVFKCEKCNVGFGKSSLYRKHMRSHKTYTCNCGEVFDRWLAILEHQRTSCTYKKEHKCVICDKTFTKAINLKQHSLNVHVPESQKETHKCPYPDCSRIYNYKRNLNFHINQHHNKPQGDSFKVFICNQCGAGLKSKKNLKHHIRALHSGLPEKARQRKSRKDKGKPKKCMASVLSGLSVPHKQNIEIMTAESVPDSQNFSIDVTENEEVKKEKIKLRKGVSGLLDKLKASAKASNKQSFKILGESESSSMSEEAKSTENLDERESEKNAMDLPIIIIDTVDCNAQEEPGLKNLTNILCAGLEDQINTDILVISLFNCQKLEVLANMNVTKKAAKKLMKSVKKPANNSTTPAEVTVKFGKPILQITFGTVKCLACAAILIFFLNMFFSIDLFISSIKTRNHLGYFINMISKGDGEILPTMQALPVLIFLLIDFFYIFFVYKLFSRKKQARLNWILFILLMVGLVFILIVFLLLIIIMVHIYGSHEELHNGITKAMEQYSNNTKFKKQIDRLQIEFQCCGSKKYDEWYNITWYDKSLMKKGVGNVSEATTPFSCCAIKTIFPCIHHNVEQTGKSYLYTPELNLSISTKGCYTKLRDKKQEVGWFIIGNLLLYIILQVSLIAVLRLLQTAHYINSKFMGHSRTYTCWLLGCYGGSNIKEEAPAEPPEPPPVPPELME